MFNKKKTWTTLLIIIAGSLVTYFLITKSNAIHYAENITLGDLLTLLLVRFVLLLGNGYTLKLYSEKYSLILKRNEWIGLSFITALGNYIGPLSFGMVAKAAYLKKRHDFPFTHFITLTGSTYIINFLCIGVLGLAGAIYLTFTSIVPLGIPLFFISVILCTVLLIIIPLPSSRSNIGIIDKILQSITGWNIIKKDQMLFFRVTLITLFNITANGLSFWIAYTSLGIKITFVQTFLISFVGIFSLLINITPANLGIQEAIISLASGIMMQNGGSSEGLLAALTVRGTTMLLVFSLGPLYSIILANEFKK